MVSLQTLLAQKDLASGTHSEISKTLTGKKTTLDHNTKVLINMIFARFHHIYTHRFESAYGDETTLIQAKREWAISLAGIPANLVELGLERCKREHAWPPTIAEFLKLVQPTPESLGLPPTDQAYLEACRNSNNASDRKWSHVCVQLAAQKVGYFVLKSESERSTRPLFSKTYLNLIQRLAEGETFTVEEHIALPEPDFDAEHQMTQALLKAGLTEPDAQQVAYYLEKPAQSDVRKRYRTRSVALLDKLSIYFDLPE
jgi:hypothetical protein